LIGLISLQSKGLSRVFSSTTVWKHHFFGAQPFITVYYFFITILLLWLWLLLRSSSLYPSENKTHHACDSYSSAISTLDFWEHLTQGFQTCEGQGSLACCNPWDHKELDTTERLNNNNNNYNSNSKFMLMGEVVNQLIKWTLYGELNIPGIHCNMIIN